MIMLMVHGNSNYYLRIINNENNLAHGVIV